MACDPRVDIDDFGLHRRWRHADLLDRLNHLQQLAERRREAERPAAWHQTEIGRILREIQAGAPALDSVDVDDEAETGEFRAR